MRSISVIIFSAAEIWRRSRATGCSIIIEIDDEDWGGLSVGPDETITIYGEVDGNTIRANEIDVKRITK